ncbi:MAG: NADP-dependent phosphogluconate dehydrogenase [Patescibacteria group bacterium]
MRKEAVIIGLGKMGKNMALRLKERRWKVLGLDKGYDFLKIKKLSRPRLLILSVPAQAVDEVIRESSKFLEKGDIIADFGNSFYKDSIRRASGLSRKGIRFVDVGISGGPSGARHGACLMVGGRRKDYIQILPLLKALALPGGLQFFKGCGAGHFVKMIHNGIEYGMMQAIAEGFAILKKSKYKLDLERVADVYNHGSVIESRLVGWLYDAFKIRGENLKKISGKVEHTGEGEWTVKTAKELGVPAKIIEGALKFRIESARKPDYAGKILSALRSRFGGHRI